MTMPWSCIKMPWPPVASLIKPKLNNRPDNTTFTTPLPQCGLSSYLYASGPSLTHIHSKPETCGPLSKNCILSLSNSQDVLPLLFIQQTPAKSSRIPKTPPFLWSLSLRQWLHPFYLRSMFFIPAFYILHFYYLSSMSVFSTQQLITWEQVPYCNLT